MRRKDFTKKKSQGPEKKIENAIRRMLHAREWFTIKLHGNKFQDGMPDLFITHHIFGVRMVEVKDPKRTGDPFTPAQRRVFPKLCKHGCPVIVAVAADDRNYNLIIQGQANWWSFLL